MIHFIKNENCYVISSHQVWMPGAYESERAAKYAFKFPDDILAQLRDEANVSDHLITFEMLQQKRKEMKIANL